MVVVGLASVHSSVPVAARTVRGIRDPEQVAAAQSGGQLNGCRLPRGDPAHGVGLRQIQAWFQSG